MAGQGTTWSRNIAKNFNRLSRVHQRYKRQTDGRPMTYSEPELEFTFAKNDNEFFDVGVGNENTGSRKRLMSVL